MRAALVALAACAPVHAGDVIAEASFATVATLDWGQTNGLVRVCGEGSPIIGRCGERFAPNLFFPLVIAAHAAIAFVLPGGWVRTTFQAFTVGVEAKTVWRNWSLGDRPSW